MPPRIPFIFCIIIVVIVLIVVIASENGQRTTENENYSSLQLGRDDSLS